MNAIQTNPIYPSVIVYAIAVYSAITAIFLGLSAYNLFSVEPFTILNGQLVTEEAAGALKVLGGFYALFALVFAWVAVGLVFKRRTIRRQTVVLNGVLVIFGTIGLLGGTSAFERELIVGLVISALTVLLLGFDRSVITYLDPDQGQDVESMNSASARTPRPRQYAAPFVIRVYFIVGGICVLLAPGIYLGVATLRLDLMLPHPA